MNKKRRKFKEGQQRSNTGIIVLLSCLLFYTPTFLSFFGTTKVPISWIILGIGMATLYAGVFCLNYFWIIPATLLRRPGRNAIFFITNVLLILGVSALVPLTFTLGGITMGPPHHATHTLAGFILDYVRFMIRDGVMLVLAVAFAYALRISQRQQEMRRRELELDAERREVELKSLKAQLNPHFLFNTLNNIYALIGISPERAQKALHDLSSMLRFMIYDSTYAEVPLTKEMHFIADYIELMKLRLNPSVRLECDIRPEGCEELRIVPLLFLTLVENAFKHESHDTEQGFISVYIGKEEKVVACRVRNTCDEQKARQPERIEESGVGLENVTRQLKLIYPGMSSFSHGREGNVYEAKIEIDINAMQKRWEEN